MILGLWPFANPSTVRVRHGEVKHWRFEQVDDRFTGHQTCRLFRGPVQVAGGVVTLNFGAGIDTSDAVYKIDNEAARSWRADIPALAAMGVRVQRDDLANPSGGVVILPLTEVAGAQTIAVRVKAAKAPRRFSLADLSAAMEAVALKDCDVRSP